MSVNPRWAWVHLKKSSMRLQSTIHDIHGEVFDHYIGKHRRKCNCLPVGSNSCRAFLMGYFFLPFDSERWKIWPHPLHVVRKKSAVSLTSRLKLLPFFRAVPGYFVKRHRMSEGRNRALRALLAQKLRCEEGRLCEKVKNLSQMTWSSTRHHPLLIERNKNDFNQERIKSLAGSCCIGNDRRRLRSPRRSKRCRWHVRQQFRYIWQLRFDGVGRHGGRHLGRFRHFWLRQLERNRLQVTSSNVGGAV